MKKTATNWIIILHKDGKRIDTLKLTEGAATIGREPGNQITLPSTSVSRHHAEMLCSADGVTVRDLDSRNGILVNGVPRKSAVLQPGDKITICEFILELAAATSAETTASAHKTGLETVLRLDETIDQQIRLPQAPHERQLATLYHVCFWVAEGIEEKALTERCLNLLRESLQAAEVHCYSADLELRSFLGEEAKKPIVKLAPFLAKMFLESKEAVAIFGCDIARHQRGVGEFNYLVCPLRVGALSQPSPFVVVLRSVDQKEFTPEDRVMLQAICQLWARGQAKTNQLVELRQENAQLKEKVAGGVLLGGSAVMNKLREHACKTAATNATILMVGETGSGKEVLAQFIHDNSPRRKGPLVKVNCAAIPDALIESELFGYVKGAFSGATRDHNGKFVQANGGTLFLDEVGEMPLLVQAKVLRAIENREVQPLGSEQAVHVDIRIIAATNRDLKAMVREKHFREDLYYRLDVQNVRVPPLRDHADDIDELAAHLLQKFCAENGLADMNFAPDALSALKQHNWPGNVRELCNVVQRAALAADDIVISAAVVAGEIERQRA